MAGELQGVVQVVKDQRKIIDALDAEVVALKERIASLEDAVIEKFGAHGLLVTQYSDPQLSSGERRQAAQAAIAYERSKAPIITASVTGSSVISLWERVKPKAIDITPSGPDSAA